MIHLQGQPLAYAAQRGMIRSRFRQAQPHEGPHGQGIPKPPTNAPFRVDALEIAQQQHAEISSGRDGASAHVVRVEGGAEVLDEDVEVGLFQQAVELLVEGVARTLGQITAGHPQGLLTLSSPTKAHRKLHGKGGWEKGAKHFDTED